MNLDFLATGFDHFILCFHMWRRLREKEFSEEKKLTFYYFIDFRPFDIQKLADYPDWWINNWIPW
ncbi:MAG: hypothetical protein VKK42_19910 [Lyngbya sp.]|nr:hypothetical protein [Lyngbya sp.]